jgi:hypothetical protein
MTSIQVTEADDQSLREVSNYVRLLGIVESATGDGRGPIAYSDLHGIAYFADALAPIYRVPVLHPRILKRSRVMANPEMQFYLDRLVGMGVVRIHDPTYSIDSDSLVFSARYDLNSELAEPILGVIRSREAGFREMVYLQELTRALLGLGTEMLWEATQVDAAFADPNADVGSIIDLLPLTAEKSRAVLSADSLRELAEGASITPAEVINLYVRHVYMILAEAGRGGESGCLEGGAA